MNLSRNVLSVVAVAIGSFTTTTWAQSPAPATAAASAVDVWTHKVKRLHRSEVDALLAQPQKLLVIDVRRPDELTAKGGFPVYLSVQSRQIESALAFIPKDRALLTVSNHAHRAGDVGDLLVSKGYKVAGAAGTEDYEAEGGTAVVRWSAPIKQAAVATGQ